MSRYSKNMKYIVLKVLDKLFSGPYCRWVNRIISIYPFLFSTNPQLTRSQSALESERERQTGKLGQKSGLAKREGDCGKEENRKRTSSRSLCTGGLLLASLPIIPLSRSFSHLKTRLGTWYNLRAEKLINGPYRVQQNRIILPDVWTKFFASVSGHLCAKEKLMTKNGKGP